MESLWMILSHHSQHSMGMKMALQTEHVHCIYVKSSLPWGRTNVAMWVGTLPPTGSLSWKAPLRWKATTKVYGSQDEWTRKRDRMPVSRGMDRVFQYHPMVTCILCLLLLSVTDAVVCAVCKRRYMKPSRKKCTSMIYSGWNNASIDPRQESDRRSWGRVGGATASWASMLGDTRAEYRDNFCQRSFSIAWSSGLGR
jgi:hypothetical protein